MEVCVKEQMEFDWACTWLGDGGMPALAKARSRG